MYSILYKILHQPSYYFALGSVFFIFSNPALSASAPDISQFDVLAVTSARYNPVLPSPLTPTTALSMNWDVISGSSQFKQSDVSHSGGWLAFVTETYGYRLNGAAPAATYNYNNVIYFGTYNLINSAGDIYGYFDEYYCVCNAGSTFRASTISIDGSSWFGNMHVN